MELLSDEWKIASKATCSVLPAGEEVNRDCYK